MIHAATAVISCCYQYCHPPAHTVKPKSKRLVNWFQHSWFWYIAMFGQHCNQKFLLILAIQYVLLNMIWYMMFVSSQMWVLCVQEWWHTYQTKHEEIWWLSDIIVHNDVINQLHNCLLNFLQILCQNFYYWELYVHSVSI